MTDARGLMDAPSPAVLVVYRPDGEAVVSPVWFRVNGESLEFVVAATDSKLNYLRADPRCQVLIFETIRPFRGVRVRANAEILPDERSATRLAIATRYLGPRDGARYADLERRPSGFVVRLPLAVAKEWDLRASLPAAE